jgi:transposase
MHKADRARRPEKESLMDAVLGIDLGKAKFQVTLLFPDGRRRRKACANSPAGCAELLGWMAHHGATHVHACLEATGTYGDLLATTLVDAGHAVSLLNPAIIYHYAKSRLARAKTDPVDADLIADYAAKEHPPTWTPVPREVRELQALVRRLDALLGMQTDERNRAQAGALTAAVQQSIEAVLAHLATQIDTVRHQIRDHIDQHPGLRAQRDLLTSIPGIGDATAALLLAELFNKAFTSARQAAAFAGVVPRPHDSGLHQGRRVMCKLGPSRLRKGLYFPAIAALRFNPSLQPLAQRLRSAGKPPMLIIGAAMRKLIHVAFGVLKSGRAYDARLAKA